MIEAELLPSTKYTKFLVPNDIWKCQKFIIDDIRRILDVKMISKEIDDVTGKKINENTPGINNQKHFSKTFLIYKFFR